MTLVLWVVGGGWVLLGALGALVIGRSIRLADRQEIDVVPAGPAVRPVPATADPCPLKRRRTRGTPPAVSRCVVATHRAASPKER
ncbi:hypothetical protein ACI782_17135 [Geodermatophilus sp. SYSU D00703]